MREAEKKDILQRLKTIEGHLRGIQRMVEEDRYCVDILKQPRAVQNALQKVDATILENHLQTCVTRALRSENEEERTRVIEELMDVYRLSDRI